MQITQGVEPGAEIVDRKANAHLVQSIESKDCGLRILHRQRFGNLDDEARKRESVRGFGYLVDQILAAELRRRNIHRDPNVIRPMLGFGAGGRESPIFDLADEPDLSGDRNEF